MDPVRRTGTTRPRESSAEPEEAPVRRVMHRTTGPGQASVPLSPRHASTHMAITGPSSLAPRGAWPMHGASLPELDAPPGSPSESSPGRVPLRSPSSPWTRADAPAPPRMLSPERSLSPSVQDLESGAFQGTNALHALSLLDKIYEHPDLQGPLTIASTLLLEADQDFSSSLNEALEQLWVQQITVAPAIAQAVQTLIDHLFPSYDAELELVYSDGSSDEDNDPSEHGDLLVDSSGKPREPLGNIVQAWATSTGVILEIAHAFDEEPQAQAFAALLARLRETEQEKASSSTAASPIAAQVASVLAAVAEDAELRAQVFLIAQTALGSCTDNLLEGFSNVLLAVRNHEMARDVQSGQVDEVQFNRWAGQQFRLSLLETVVHQLIHQELQRDNLEPEMRRYLMKEPVQTMAHAKQSLRDRLDLPRDTLSHMQSSDVSTLRDSQLFVLEELVKAQAQDRVAQESFLMNHSTWRTGMKALHPEKFAPLAQARDEDPFFDRDVPQDLEGQMEYAAEARAVEAKWQREEEEVFRSLARGNQHALSP